MHQHNTRVSQQKWHDSGHASLCVLGKYLRQIGFFEPLERRVHLEQKVLKYTPIQKLEMLFVGLLTGIKAVSHTATSVRVDVALTAAFGRPRCADQSVLADTLDAAQDGDVADLQAALAELFAQYSQARQHPFDQELLVLDVDLSPLPASKHAQGSERGSPSSVSLQDGAQVSPRTGCRHGGDRVGDSDLGTQRREFARAARSDPGGRAFAGHGGRQSRGAAQAGTY